MISVVLPSQTVFNSVASIKLTIPFYLLEAFFTVFLFYVVMFKFRQRCLFCLECKSNIFILLFILNGLKSVKQIKVSFLEDKDFNLRSDVVYFQFSAEFLSKRLNGVVTRWF